MEDFKYMNPIKAVAALVLVSVLFAGTAGVAMLMADDTSHQFSDTLTTAVDGSLTVTAGIAVGLVVLVVLAALTVVVNR